MPLSPEQVKLVLRAIDHEVKNMHLLRSQMVGSLYPGIVATEIDRLLRSKREIERLAESDDA